MHLRRIKDEGGMVLVLVLAALTLSSGLTVAAFSAANGDQRIGRHDQDAKRAYAAAEGGLHLYLYHLNEDNAYWTKCAGVPPPSPVNQVWNGVGGDPRVWRALPDSSARYTIELLPANGNPTCNPAQAEATMIDATGGTFRIQTTGEANGVKRSIITTLKRRGFLDFLYFTDYETTDPTWYALDTRGRQTRTASTNAPPDLVTWASTACPRYRRAGRASQSYDGEIFWFNSVWTEWDDTCTEIQFASTDVIAGPLHTNDELLTCGAPVFGRNTQDRIEVSGSGWRGQSGCSGNAPNFTGTLTTNAPVLTLPPTDSKLKTIALPAYTFTGTTRIVLNGSSMAVTNAAAGLTNASMSLPANGVVYVQNGACGQAYNPLDPYTSPAACGDAQVSGTYSDDVTIAAERDVVIHDSILRTDDAMLGLIANAFVRVRHTITSLNLQNTPVSCSNASGSPTNIRVDAAILALQHSFTVDSYFCGSTLGTLTVNGVIAQRFRGPVGRASGNSIVSGYRKAYTYDDRLRYRSPPHFLDPVQAAWRIQRQVDAAAR